MMEKRRALLVVVLVISYALVVTAGGYREVEGEERKEKEEGEGEEGRRESEDWFLLQDSKHVVQTEAGEMKVVRGVGGKFVNNPMHIGFITMEPKSLFIPQYLDSSLILFIRRGEARIGSIYKDELEEQRLKTGDVYRIEAGSAFYLENTGEGQRLHVICSIDTSQSLNWHLFQTFFIGGGTNPTSILAGFDAHTLSTAFNVSTDELREIMTSQQSGAIISLSPDSHPPSVWTRFWEQELHERLANLKRIVRFENEPITSEEEEEEEEKPKWSWRKLLRSVFAEDSDDSKTRRTKSRVGTYNVYDRKPDFKNNYGWSVAIDESAYKPLRHSGIGVYLVNLTAGSMMAPHINPTAAEYGIVLRGVGSIEIVYPNGSLAMNAKVSEGDVFWVPRYFPVCQIASRSGPFEFFGFSTSSRKNRPQFLVGTNSILHTMNGPEFATSFGVSEDKFRKIIDAQHEGVILPTASVAPPDEIMEKNENEIMSRLVMI